MVSEATKELFERRTRTYKRAKPTSEQRKKWNQNIRNACRNDYRSWVARWVERIEAADNKGDTRTIYSGVKALGGSAAFELTKPTEHMPQKEENNLSRTNENRDSAANGETEETKKLSANENAESKMLNKEQTANKEAEKNETETKSETTNENAEAPANRTPRPQADRHGQLGRRSATNENAKKDVTEKKNAATNKNTEKTATRPPDGQGSRISSPRELAQVWKAFLETKFSQTDLERARDDYDALPDSADDDSELTREEFNQAVKQMKKGKTTGMDGVPAEVWQSSSVTQDALFEFISKVWRKAQRARTSKSRCVHICYDIQAERLT